MLLEVKDTANPSLESGEEGEEYLKPPYSLYVELPYSHCVPLHCCGAAAWWTALHYWMTSCSNSNGSTVVVAGVVTSGLPRNALQCTAVLCTVPQYLLEDAVLHCVMRAVVHANPNVLPLTADTRHHQSISSLVTALGHPPLVLLL